MIKNILLSVFILFSTMLIAQKKLTSDNSNRLSFNLLKQINTKNKNVLISAYSVSNALAMTYVGAKEKTKQEMETLLFPRVNETVSKDISELNEALSFNKKLELFLANAIWMQKSYKPERKYSKIMTDDFLSKINTANFIGDKGQKKARKEINSWVEDKTKEMIKDFIAPHTLSDATIMVLVNAIYFRGKWDIGFSEKNTYKGKFNNLENEEDCKFMTNNVQLSYYTDDLLSAVEIPYEDNEASMIILLAKEKNINLSDSLNNQYLKNIIRQSSKRKVNLHLPVFKIESEYELSDYLKEMGMNSAFNTSADFSGITGSKDIHISNIIHKAVIEVNESGTKASAATAVIATRSTSLEPKSVTFKADRSFVFLIKEKSTGIILFMGSLAKP